MQKILIKRVFRDLRKDFFRYFALFLLVMMGMYLIISIVDAAESVIVRVEEASDRNRVEDGEFSVIVPLEASRLQELNGKGLTLEEAFYLDYTLKDNSTLRIYRNREKINLIDLDEGRLAENSNEIVLEKHYAGCHELIVGSTVSIADKDYTVTGIGSVPDYDAPLKNMSDPSVDSDSFGMGFVSGECYDGLKKEGKFAKAEEYVYTYLLNGNLSQDELKTYLRDIELDRSKVTDTYFLEWLDELEEDKNRLLEGVDDLAEGTADLSDGLTELSGQNTKIRQGMQDIFQRLLINTSDDLGQYGITVSLTEENYHRELNNIINQAGSIDQNLKAGLKAVMKELDSFKEFKDGMAEYTDGTGDAAEGSKELLEGVGKLQDKTDEIVEEYFSPDIDNLTQFVEKENNPRIAASVDDTLINKQVGIAAGIVVMVLLTYVISVFVVHGIEQDSTVIGALYALGVTGKQLVFHYIMLPVVITFFAGAAGTAIGLSPYGADRQTLDTVNYFSIPEIRTVYPAFLLIYGMVMPPLTAAIVNYIVIGRKLSRPALKLLQNDRNQSGISNLQLNKLSFTTCFRIRQFLREIRCGLAVVMGMFIALLILMLGADCYVICHNMSVQNKQDTTYEYMYSYKYPDKEVPAGGEAFYSENLKKEVLGYDLDVTLLGIVRGNKYFNFDAERGENKVAVSKSAATKYRLSVSDDLVLHDEVNDKNYAFTVDKIVPYSVGLYVFMDINSMRELFGREDGYFNLVLSDRALNLDTGRLYAVTARTDVNKRADIFMNHMWPMIITMLLGSALIFIVVMYLMMKVMIDRSAFSISLMKIFGYREKEVRSLYLNGNTIMVAIAAAICIPLSKMVMDAMYPYLVSNVACGMDLTFTWQMYLGLYLGIMLCYGIINKLLTGKLKRMVPSEVLKNRE